MNNIFSTIDHDQLSNVSGGASPSSLVLNKLDGRFGSQGVVGFDGKPKVTELKTLDHISGKFDVNALWGGDTDYSFKATEKGGKITSLHTKLLGGQ